MNTLKKSKIVFVIFFAMIMLLGFDNKAFAKKNVGVKNFNVKAQLMNDGSLSVTEDITMKFDGKFNGGFKDISTRKTEGIKNVKVYYMNNGVKQEFKYVHSAENGDYGVYEISKKTDNMYRVKIYMPSRNVTRTFRIKYTLANCGKVYNDVGELYYNFWDSGYETRVENLEGTIILPEDVLTKNIKAFPHGPMNVSSNILDNRTIKFNARDIKSNDYVSGRIIFPREILSKSRNIVDANGLENILKQEKEYKSSLQKKIMREKKLQSFAKYAFWVILFIDIILIAFYIKITKRDTEKYSTQMFPQECSPAIMAKYFKGSVNGVDFIATLIDLNRRGHLQIEKIDENEISSEKSSKRKKKNKEDYKIVVIENGYNDKLHPHEIYLLDWLFKNSNYDGSIKMSKLEKIAKKDSFKYIEFSKEWNKLIKEEAESSGYYDKSKRPHGVLYICAFSIQVIFSIIIMTAKNAGGILIFMLTFIMLIFGLILMLRISDLAYSEKVKWKKIREDFKNGQYLAYSFEKYVPYLVSLNVDVDHFQKFRNFAMSNERYLNNVWLMSYFAFDSFTRHGSFMYWGSTAFVNSAAGGAAGGSTGGGAGCGGGGAGGF
ncbi:DUF2207 domain-containing protein [Haloimpatiens sp. FM7330]|uniref:DUF2207 domain-containing protein n=1 Tax=Haloimpatiens sp. FM7330 TaxID=3298610 RepID=UPI00362FBB84